MLRFQARRNFSSFNKIPKRRLGLYDPALEKDSCGVGMIANLKGKPSHRIVADANEMLARMSHRGGCGCEVNTGDGAGILVGMPDGFMRKVAQVDMGISLPEQYAAGLVFTSLDREAADQCKKIMAQEASRYEMEILGWREVPTNNTMLGTGAKLSEPFIEQIFVASKTKNLPADEFDRQLMRMRKTSEHAIAAENLDDFYVCSLSSRTITYKGQLTPEQLPQYYLDLVNKDFSSHLALVHSRFSTNTFPSWDRAQPNRMLCHNGEINTLRGNKNWMLARSGVMHSPVLNADDQSGLMPICSDNMTDSGNADSVLELLTRGSNRSVPEAIMMMIPEAWQNDSSITGAKRAFYEFNSCIMEPWDGPAMMAFTDGRYVGACLDRNGLRPSRYYVTDDDHVLLSSEVGVLPSLDPATVKYKGRLEPGKLFLIDFEKQALINDTELKDTIAGQRDYQGWLDRNLVQLNEWTAAGPAFITPVVDTLGLGRKMNAFNYTVETLDLLLAPMAITGKEALGSMGVDAPLAVLSRLPKNPFDYFKQLFAQVTNPPIDPIREEIVMSLRCPVGPEENLLEVSEGHANRMVIENPILTQEEMGSIKAQNRRDAAFKKKWYSTTLDATYPKGSVDGLRKAVVELCKDAEKQVKEGKVPVLILTHDNVNADRIPVPSLVAVGAVHQHLVKNKLRTQCALFVDCGDAREVHDFCTLFGFGADAVCPTVAYDAVKELNKGKLAAMNGGVAISDEQAIANYRKAANKGILKVMSKMGISTLQSYKGAQIFEAVGMDSDIVDICFTGTTTRIEGAGFDALSTDLETMHTRGFPTGNVTDRSTVPQLSNPGDYHYRHGGEAHYNDPQSMADLQHAVQESDPAVFKKYSEYTQKQNAKISLRGIFAFHADPAKSVSIDEVEPVGEIVKRFVTGAMSLGSISAEAHEALAMAMNKLGGRSNTGEGGEDPMRFTWRGPNGENKRSAIKQVASGRFGVTAEYLANSDQIQIKMAQGAKPGEGGELPGYKVTKEIAKVRGTTPGVGLISPPPHHDIYSIEDLAQLIHDLKNANPDGTVSVKLVSEVGVGIVAAGSAKSKADHIVVSGGDGGTGAAAWTGIHRAGLPWELGIAEAQQTLVVNNLRSRVRLQADGQMKTGRDVVIAALMGAEEFGFSTTPLIALGCIMMRKCHLNTCPVGIATQDPELRKKFNGQPLHVTNFFYFLGEEVRSYMALLGFRTFDEMIGRTDKLKMNESLLHYKTKGLNLDALLQPASELNPEAFLYHNMLQDHGLDSALDLTLIAKSAHALSDKKKVYYESGVNNLNRTVGTMLSNRIAKAYGNEGLPHDTIHIKLNGSAGQSLGFVLAKGVTLEVEGDANDGVGKCLSGGKIIVYPHKVTMESQPTFVPEDNVIVGNVALYGATSGEAYFRGKAGERFCVRNSGGSAVVEGMGDHGCEYMTGGRVVCLGDVGRNFAAGMSGGIAYIWDPNGSFSSKVNSEMVGLEKVEEEEDVEELRSMLQNHRRYTASGPAKRLLENWEESVGQFVKVMPHDYKRVLEENKSQALRKAAAF